MIFSCGEGLRLSAVIMGGVCPLPVAASVASPLGAGSDWRRKLGAEIRREEKIFLVQ